MKNILLPGAAILLSTGLAFAQSPATNATNGGNSGMNNSTTSMSSSSHTTTGMSSTNAKGNGAGSNGMSMTQIRHKLAAQGYVHIKDLRHNGKYEMVNAHRYGSDQKTIKIDPTTGRVVDQAKLSDSQVRNMLKAHHYTDIDDVTHHGNVITAKVKKGGQSSKITINARSGAIVSG